MELLRKCLVEIGRIYISIGLSELALSLLCLGLRADFLLLLS